MQHKTPADAALTFEHLNRFSICQHAGTVGGRWTFQDSLSPRSARVEDGFEPDLGSREGCLAALRMLLPPCIVPAPLPVRDRPESIEDSHFWQFPAITERLAFERHAALPPPDWHPEIAGPVHAYLGLPWASYIDKKEVPDLVRQVFGVRVRGYRALASDWGLTWGEDVAVHTVCQQIFWPRLLPLWAELGVTDLHLSHCQSISQEQAQPWGIRVHPWLLVAPNLINPERREGLVVGKPLAERKLLASFVGAYAIDYLSNVRLRLRDEAARWASADVVFEMNEHWHFFPAVYQAQVKGVPLTDAQLGTERAQMVRYNRLLSDSVFSLCPEGSGPNTLRLWESLAVGAIPVVLVGDWVPPPVPAGAPRWEESVIMQRPDDVAGIFDRLRRLREDEPDRLAAMQAAGMDLYERFSELTCF